MGLHFGFYFSFYHHHMLIDYVSNYYELAFHYIQSLFDGSYSAIHRRDSSESFIEQIDRCYALSGNALARSFGESTSRFACVVSHYIII